MIITSDNIVFLENPKCASTSLRQIIDKSKKFEKRFVGDKRINQSNYNYDSPYYRHCNLESAATLLYVKKEDPWEYCYFTTIRNPYDRFTSAVGFPDEDGSLPDFKSTLDIDSHFLKFVPEKFRFFGKLAMTGLIRVEHFLEDLNFLNNKYRLGLMIDDIPHENKSKGEKSPFIWTDYMVDSINRYFEPDFIQGKYKTRTAEELNHLQGDYAI